MIITPKIALYEPDIPQNTAAIIRTCACLGVKLEIIEPCGFLFNDQRFKRVVLDYMNKDEIKFYNDFDNFINAKNGKRIVLMTTKVSMSYTKFKFKNDDTILFGRESSGVPDKVHELSTNRLTIPMRKNKRSLNVATSVAIVLSESLKQLKII